MKVQGHRLEDVSFNATKKEFFKEYQEKTTSTSKEKLIPMHKAGELVYI